MSIKEEIRRPLLYQYFANSADILLAEYTRSKAQNAAANLGDNREIFCGRFLDTILAPRLETQRGEIWDGDGRRTGQLDLIIVRDDLPTIVFGRSNSYFVESVLAVIEVKSNLGTSKLKEALDQLRLVKELHCQSPGVSADLSLDRPLRCIFAYQGNKLDRLRDELLRPENIGIVDVVSVLNRGIIVANNMLLTFSDNAPYGLCSGKAAALSWLYFFLANYGAGFAARVVPASYFEPFNNWADDDPKFLSS